MSPARTGEPTPAPEPPAGAAAGPPAGSVRRAAPGCEPGCLVLALAVGAGAALAGTAGAAGRLAGVLLILAASGYSLATARATFRAARHEAQAGRALEAYWIQRLQSPQPLSDVTLAELEDLLVHLYRQLGYEVEAGSGTPEEGRDLHLRRRGRRELLRYGTWQQPVTVEQVADLYEEVVAARAARGICVTLGVVSTAAQVYAAGKPLELIDRAGLLALLLERRSV